MSHIPVLRQEVLDIFSAENHSIHHCLDGTFGRGGHSRAILEHFTEAKVYSLDQDLEAIEYGTREFSDYIEKGKLVLKHANFSEIPECLEQKYFDAILLDLGVSSPQLDNAVRGFSFYDDGPLDMRMDQSRGERASEIINNWDAEDLITLFREAGEVRSPYRVVRAIVNDRKESPYKTTRELASLVERVDGWRKKGHHPATKYFMALRLQVNQELDQLGVSLPKLIDALTDGGRLIVISFHSLEDRIVKNIFKSELGKGRLINKKVIRPQKSEVDKNARSRSAKLRAFEKGGKNESKPS